MSNPPGSFAQSGGDIYASPSKKENLWLYLFGFFLLNLIIKSFSITKVSFDLDEAWHTYFSQKGILEILKIAGTDPNGPFFNLLMHYWIKLVGVSEVATRSLSVILSAATAPLIFLLGKKYFNTLTGIFAALIFSFSNLHFFFSHNARVYALICFLAVLSFLFLFELVKSKRYLSFIGLIIADTLLLYTHLTTSFFIAAEGLIALLFFKESRKGTLLAIAALVISVLLFIPWVVLTPYYNEPTHGIWLHPPDWSKINLVLDDFAGTKYILNLFMGLFILSFIIRQRSSWQDSWKLQLILFLWFCIPLICSVFVSHYFVPVFQTKYVMTSSLGLYFLVAYSLSLIRFSTGIKFIVIAYLLVKLYPSMGWYEFITEDWRTAVKEVKERKTDRTMVIVSPWYMHYPFCYYYNRDYYIDTKHTLELLNRERIFFGQKKEIILHQPTDYDQVILVTTHEKMIDPESILGHLQSHLLSACEISFPSIKMHCFTKPATITFGSDMETSAQSFKLNKVVEKNFAHSGSRVSIVNVENPFSATFEDKRGAFSQQSKSIVACGWVYYEDKNVNCTFVVSLENSGGSFFYDAVEVSQCGPKGKWFRICRKVKIPEGVTSDDLVKVYVWNKSKSPVYVDDMEITEIK